MGNLILDSLEIRNFRGFEHFTIERLGRVNLIVGKNNIGKSSLLEALLLYARRGSPNEIWNILDARDESGFRHGRAARSRSTDQELLSALKYLFYGRKEIQGYPNPILIGPINTPQETLSIDIGWFVSRSDENGLQQRWQQLQPEEINTVDNPSLRFAIQVGNQPGLNYPLAGDRLGSSILSRYENEGFVCIYISAQGLESDRNKDTDLVGLWDRIALRPLESEVLNSLRIMAPGIERLDFIGSSASSLRSIPVPVVKIAGIDEPLPLRSLGDGMQRVLGIVLALVNAKDGMVLIDEFENGIHYSTQAELWQIVFQLAHRLNVQVFATTHSWDCIEGFQKAAQESKQDEGILIRLSLKGDEVISTIFDERKLAIATREQIEVR
jgi:ABC-type transport system involved in cytochrome c biogenesis ATPase subunit